MLGLMCLVRPGKQPSTTCPARFPKAWEPPHSGPSTPEGPAVEAVRNSLAGRGPFAGPSTGKPGIRIEAGGRGAGGAWKAVHTAQPRCTAGPTALGMRRIATTSDPGPWLSRLGPGRPKETPFS